MQFLVTGENFNKILDALNEFDEMDVLSIAVDEAGLAIKNITNIGEGIKWIGETQRPKATRRRRVNVGDKSEPNDSKADCIEKEE